MPTPPPNRSAYRERRINVMLQDDSAAAPQVSSDPLSADPGTQFHATTPAAAPMRLEASRNRMILVISAATALLCAAVVLFVLFRRDNSQTARASEAQLSPTQIPSTQSASHSPAPAITTPEAAAPAIAAPLASQTQPASEGERIRFRLKRSARAQSFGAFQLRLLTSSPRRGLCQLAISNSSGRAQRTLEINRPASVKLAENTTVEVLVNGLTRDTITGFLTSHP